MEESTSDQLRRWQDAGLLTRAQADAIRLFEAGRPRPRPAAVRSELSSRLPPPASGGVELPPRPPSGRPRALPGIHAWTATPPASDPLWLAVGLGALATLGIMGAAIGVVTDLFLAPLRLFTTDLEESIHLAASVVALVGAAWMYQQRPVGRRMVLFSLGLNIAATLGLGYRKLADPATLVVMAVWIGLGFLIFYRNRLPRATSGWRS